MFIRLEILKRSLLIDIAKTEEVQGDPERPLYETVKVKHKLRWSSQDLGDFKTLRHLPSKLHTDIETSLRDVDAVVAKLEGWSI